ncbi:MAG: hypothetical protein ACJA2H_001327, partial [Nitriliruptoraceae bacterium]
QVWVAWLVLVNLIGAADRSTPTGRETRRATWVFLPVNTALVIVQRGYSGALSFSHLVAWPLLVLRLLRRRGDVDCGGRERRVATLVAVTNAVSLAFDVLDASRWIGGHRAIAGARRESIVPPASQAAACSTRA